MIEVNPSIDNGTGYFWAYFTGEGEAAEAISFSLSKGNDALNWYTLNNGKPSLYSVYGEKGLRDPFIFRATHEKKFYLLATDTKIYQRPGNGFETAQINGSRYIEIFESDNLVNWSKQRHVLVSNEFFGNTWAPKIFWDNRSKQYLVFWASNIYEEEVEKRNKISYNRIVYVTTQDFYNFSKPEIWVDVDAGPGKGTIDATIVKEGEWYYRFMKEESTMTIRLDRTKNLFAKVIGRQYASKNSPENQWCTIGDNIASGLSNGERSIFHSGEGPMIFYANREDINQYRWFLFIDQPHYHGGPNHYVGFASNTLEDPCSWMPISDILRNGLPKNEKGEKPRHGSIISLTSSEYDYVYQHCLK